MTKKVLQLFLSRVSIHSLTEDTALFRCSHLTKDGHRTDKLARFCVASGFAAFQTAFYCALCHNAGVLGPCSALLVLFRRNLTLASDILELVSSLPPPVLSLTPLSPSPLLPSPRLSPRLLSRLCQCASQWLEPLTHICCIFICIALLSQAFILIRLWHETEEGRERLRV